MTKQHFIALADHIKDVNANKAHPYTFLQIQELANFCQSQNPRFDRARWLAYIAGTAGPNGGKR